MKVSVIPRFVVLLLILHTPSAIRAQSPADLSVSSGPPTVTPSTQVSGGVVELSNWTLKNSGAATAFNFSNGYYLSTDPTITNSDTRLSGVFVSSIVGSTSQEITGGPLTIPSSTLAGDYYLGILVDETDTVFESSNSNNYVSSPITVLAPGSVSGMKWQDVDGDGSKEEGEPGLPGWTINLVGPDTLSMDTDSLGDYSFTGLRPGTYTVSEFYVSEGPSPWVQSYPPDPGTYTVVVAGDTTVGNDFGNWMPPGSIRGIKWYDVNQNGVRDQGEPGLEDWQINLPYGNFTLTATTDALGNYSFTGILAGIYSVSEELQPGWIQTYPPTGEHIVFLGAGQVVDTVDFGNWIAPGSIHGMKWNDYNGDGLKDQGEPGLEGWQITSTGPVTDTTTTDFLGNYWFMNLPPGAYMVEEILQEGWMPTFPPPTQEPIPIIVLPGLAIENVDFGNRMLPGSIHGMKWDDSDGDGVKDQEELGLEGWEIVITGVVALATTTDPLGNYLFMDLPPGLYTVAEIPQAGWVKTYPPELETYTIELASGETVEGINFGNWIPTGGIHGKKWFDMNMNGGKDPEEPGLPGWEIVLEGAAGVLATTTDSSGYFSFMNLSPGIYTVFEILQPGWTQTHPSPLGVHSLYLGPGEIVDSLDFGNWRPETTASIHGMKWNDLNGDGVKDLGEPGLEGWEISLTGGDTLSTTTDSLGNYWFMSLAPGEYAVVEVVQPGWSQTFPPLPGTHIIVLDQGQRIEGVDFGNWRTDTTGSIHGKKWYDLNENGEKDPDEPGIPGWEIVIEGAANLTTLTDSDGNYWFMGLASGSYVVSEVPQPGWIQTHPPAPGTYTVDLAGGEVVDTADFGNWRPDTTGSIHGMKWFDLNENGQKDPDEPGLPEWEIVVGGAANLRATTDSDGSYWFMGLAPGTYIVSEMLQPGWVQTYPPTPGMHVVGLEQGQIIDGMDFGNWRIDTTGSIHGMKWHDINGNSEQEPNEPGLPGWEITITGLVNLTTTTDSSGTYWFMGLAPGVYLVSELLQPGWIQTYPAFPETYTVELGPDQVVESIDFGNWWVDTTGSIGGIKWHDLDSNGEKDPDEPGLPGWRINLAGLDTLSTTTDSAGYYSFVDLGPGVYLVSEVPQAGWVQTYPPPPAIHEVELGPGEVIETVDFGNSDDFTSVGPENRIPDKFELFQNYPNPFNPSTLIRFRLPKSSYVTLKVYNVLGEELETLVSGERSAGEYVVAWNPKNQPSGIYLYRLQVGDPLRDGAELHSAKGAHAGQWFVETKKLILMR